MSGLHAVSALMERILEPIAHVSATAFCNADFGTVILSFSQLPIAYSQSFWGLSVWSCLKSEPACLSISYVLPHGNMPGAARTGATMPISSCPNDVGAGCGESAGEFLRFGPASPQHRVF